MKNNSVNLFRIWTSGSGGDVVFNISYLELWLPSWSVEQNHLCNFEKGHHGKHSCENNEIWTSGSGDVVFKYFLSGARAALFRRGVEPFVQFW